MPLPNTGIQKAESLRIIKIRILLLHVVSLGVFFVPYDNALLVLAAITYFARTFGWEGGSHRYFAHRSYKTSRAFQLFLAILAASGGQRGPIWWAWHHRLHHRHSETELDPHSPVQKGFIYAHFLWYLDPKYIDTDLDTVKDLAKYPELVWINKYHYFVPYLLMAAIFCLGQFTTVLGPNVNGVSAIVWGFFLSTALSLHSTFVVNTITHGISPRLFSYRAFATSDTSTNNWCSLHRDDGASWRSLIPSVHERRAPGLLVEIDPTYWIRKFLEKIVMVGPLTRCRAR
jgi:stearoyl-CoA desaturase (delta-9 desaturase)